MCLFVFRIPVAVLIPGLAYSIAPLSVKVNSGILHLYCKSFLLHLQQGLAHATFRVCLAFSWLFGILMYVFLLSRRVIRPNPYVSP